MTRRLAAFITVGVLGVAAVASTARAQSLQLLWPDRFETRLRALEGSWKGTGAVEGMGPVTATLTISHDEGAAFYRCEQVVRSDKETVTDFGFFYLRMNPRTYQPDLRVLWMNGKGYILQGRGEVETDALVFTLDTSENLPPGVRGRTRLETPDKDRLLLTLEFGVPVSKLQEVVNLAYDRVPSLVKAGN